MAGRVVLHIGAPKAGTTHVQSRLHRNAASLAAHGVLVPGRDLTFRAALDVTGIRLGRGRDYTDGRWEQLVGVVDAHRSCVVASDEAFSRADEPRTARAVGDLGVTDVVCTARDLARQLVSGWLEGLKHGQSASFSTYLERARTGSLGTMRTYDLPAVLGRWAAALGDPARVHLVTLPPEGGDRGLLWSRFGEACGLDETWLPEPAARSNEAVGLRGAQLLRELNERLGAGARRGGALHDTVQRRVVPGLVGGTPRVRLAPAHHGWVAERTATWVDGVRSLGVDVVGDLADLAPVPVDPAGWLDPDDVPPAAGQEAERLVADLLRG